LAPTFQDVFLQVKREIEAVSTREAVEMLLTSPGKGAALIDVRESNEWEEGHIPGAVHIPRSYLEERIETAVPDRSRPVILYCAAGVRSAFAAKTLKEMGYEHPISMDGGFGRWKDEGRAFVTPRVLNAEQLKRYSRHVLIPEVGEAGQLKLLDASVLLVGAGGLGSPAALYLAAAGVGTMGIVDSDVVDESNLQRQVLHTTDRVGTPKVDSAKATLSALNPHITVTPYNVRMRDDNIDDLLAPYDIVVDGGDNFDTRYLLNDACVRLGKPNVSASILSFDGQLTTFIPGESGCYRCVFPEPPPAGMAPSCGQSGVLGVLPGVMGTLQATEVLKLILGIGEPLVGRLLMFDALSMTFMELRLRRDPECPVCGHATMAAVENHREAVSV